jgi:hypothetical protein
MPEKQTLLPSTALPGYQLFEGSLKRLFSPELGTSFLGCHHPSVIPTNLFMVRTGMKLPLAGYHMLPSDTHPTLVKSLESPNFQRIHRQLDEKPRKKKTHPLILNKATNRQNTIPKGKCFYS